LFDTITPSGKMMFQMCGVFSEFERSMIRQRVKAGLERAVTNGKKLGRPRLSHETRQEIREMRLAGMSVRKIAVALGISAGAVCAVVKERDQRNSQNLDSVKGKVRIPFQMATTILLRCGIVDWAGLTGPWSCEIDLLAAVDLC
jgi:DNA invertase Pin-like site-specific DNA recombinase